MKKEELKRVVELLDGYRDEVIYLERELTRRPAISPQNGGKGELQKALFIEDYLRNRIGGVDIKRYDAFDERAEGGVRPNLVVTIPGEENQRRVWIMCHMDVVPAGDLSKWDSDPWDIRVEGDKIFGRGTEDNQQGIVSSLILVRALKEGEIAPIYPLSLLFVSDEETGSDFGIKYLLNNYELFKKEDLIIVPDGGDKDGAMIEVAEKGILWIKFSIIGKETHASTPEKGINAHKVGAYLITKLDSLYEKFSYKDELFSPPISTFEPTKKVANVEAINIIPGEDTFYFDCRIVPNYSLEEIIGEIEKIVKEIEDKYNVKIGMEFPQRMEPAPSTSPQSEVVRRLKKAIKEIYNVEAKPIGIGGGTVASHIRKKGYNVVVWARMDETMHSPNEYALISNIIGDAKVFAYLCLDK